MKASSLEEVLANRTAENMVKLAVNIRGTSGDSECPPAEIEWLWSKPIAVNTFEVANIPFYTKEFSWQDVVSAESLPGVAGGAPFFQSVVQHKGHSTYRIRFLDENAYSPADKVSIKYHLTLLDHLGCRFELGDYNLAAVDAGPTVALPGVCFILTSGSEDGIWDWEAGYVVP